MSIEFVDPKGNPVVIRRPDLIVALKAYTRDDRQTGEVKINTVAMFGNRDVVFIAGSPEIVNAAILKYEADQLVSDLTAKGRISAVDVQADGYVCQDGDLAAVMAPTFDRMGYRTDECVTRPDGSPFRCKAGPCEHDRPPVIQREDCPYAMCPTPLDHCREGCKVVASEVASND